MTDSFFIGTVARAHRLWRHFKIDQVARPFDIAKKDDEFMKSRMKIMNGGQEKKAEDQPEVGMMVSLDHTIYFHRPKDFRADDWMISEMDTPWSGDGRGLVAQRIWTKDGKHIATCFQEVSLLARRLHAAADLWGLTGARSAKASQLVENLGRHERSH